MTLSSSISTFGTEAVQEYRKISGGGADNDVPEVFIGSWIARQLHEKEGMVAHVERSYMKMALELGHSRSIELTQAMGGWRADMALYEHGRPSAILEIKVFDEGGKDVAVYRDLQKMRSLSKGQALQTFLGVLITDTIQKKCVARARELEEMLGGKFDESLKEIRAGSGTADWSWLFACGNFT